MLPLATALFFPDYGNTGVPWDLVFLHFFLFAIFIAFTIIFNATRSFDRENLSRIKDQSTPYPNLHPRSYVLDT